MGPDAVQWSEHRKVSPPGSPWPVPPSAPQRKGRHAPRYFFTVEGSEFPEGDEDGTVLAGPAEARSALVTLASELLTEAHGRFWTGAEWRLRATDEHGATVCVLTIKGSSEAG